MSSREFERLYRSSRGRALSIAKRRASRITVSGRQELAEDLLQLAATTVWRAIQRGQVTIVNDGHFLALLTKHVHWAASDLGIRSDKHYTHHELLTLSAQQVQGLDGEEEGITSLADRDPHTWMPSAEDTTLSRDIDPSTTRALLKLSQRKRELLWLHHAQDMGARELAPLFGITWRYAQVTIDEARAEVRHNVEHPGEVFQAKAGYAVPLSIAHRKHGTKKCHTASQTRCVNGHRWADQEPLFHPTNGYRVCRVCKLESNHRGRARARMNQPPPGVIRVGETCNKGHLWTKETLYVDPTGQRSCRICACERTARYRARKRELASS